MRRSPLGAFVLALVVRAMLDRGTNDGKASPRRAGAARRGRAGAGPTREPGARPARARAAVGLLAVGALAMLVFESTITRVIGVLALFGFVVAGVFAIADPGWLGAMPALEQAREDPGSRSGASGYGADAEHETMATRSTPAAAAR